MRNNKKIVWTFIVLISGCLWACERQESNVLQPKSDAVPTTTTKQTIVQVLGHPYVDDPDAPEWWQECERGWREFPAKAEAGDAEAQNKLAHMYYDNYNLDCATGGQGDEGEKHNPKKALDLFLKSAEQGNVDSMFMAGLIYLEGPAFYNYPKQNSPEAEKWLIKAFNAGKPVAALELTRIYAQGLGMPKNPSKARQWANKALKANPTDKSVNYYLGLLALDEKEYTKAAQLFADCPGEKHGENVWRTAECHHASYQLGKLYEQGLGVPKDLKKAAELYNEARSREDFNPILTPDEDIKTVAMDRLWYIAIYKDNPSAQYELGRRYESGEGVAQDKVRAAEWYSRAAKQNNPDALYALAIIDIENLQGDQHYCVIDWLPEKREMLEKAANQGHAQAAYELGKMYQNGMFIGGNSVTNGCLGWGWRYSDVVIGRDEEKAKYYFDKSGMQPPPDEGI